MKNILKIIILFLFLLPIGCTKALYVPVQGEHTIEYRDSLVYLRDTIFVTPPVEEKENKTLQDSSHLETSIAVSDAWIDEDNNLNHTLKNKSDTVIKYIYDTVVVTKNVKEYIEKPVITEVEKEIPYVPTFAWICIIYSILSIGMKIYRLFRKVI